MALQEYLKDKLETLLQDKETIDSQIEHFKFKIEELIPAQEKLNLLIQEIKEIINEKSSTPSRKKAKSG